MKKNVVCLCLLLSVCGYAQKIKVACVGNSVTYGSGIADREKRSYPAQLQQLLGHKYDVRNFGKPGATLLAKTFRPYVEQEEFRAALGYVPDLVVIHLGLNDTDPRAWPNFRDDFIPSYRAIIDSFRVVNPKAKIWICKMTPIGSRHPRFRSGTRDWHSKIQEEIERVSEGAKTGLIDFHTLLYHHPELFPDALHPNAKGAAILAKTVYGALTGDFGGLRMPLLYTDSMVLQRDKALVIDGRGDTGSKVSVEIAGQKQYATVDNAGKWSVQFRPMSAGGPYKLMISSNKQKLEYRDVMIGEVWLCSGQSNMAFMVKQSASGRQDISNASLQKNIRLFNMKPRWETDAVTWDSIALGSLNSLDYYKSSCWTGSNAQSAADFSAIAYRFGVALADSLKVPVGLICNAVGGSTTESWIDRRSLEFGFPDMLTDWLSNDHIMDWARGRAALNIKGASDPLQRHPYEPCYLYEAGIMPLEKYAVKGIVWYQGESNAHNIELHERLFPMLVNSWRGYFENKEMPFLFVQLSSIDRPSWCWFRDSQRRLADSIPRVNMVVSSDMGDSLDVHPSRKREIGERLTRLALHNVYGRKEVVPTGPVIKGAEVENGVVLLSFDNAEGLHTSNGDAPAIFEIAGSEGLFYPAQSAIENKTVRVRIPEQVKVPVEIRYGWQPFTRANLVNGHQLPASTFRVSIK